MSHSEKLRVKTAGVSGAGGDSAHHEKKDTEHNICSWILVDRRDVGLGVCPEMPSVVSSLDSS